MTGTQKLQDAISRLQAQAHVHGWCLLYVRNALNKTGVRIPPPQDPPNNTAIWNGQHLGADPAVYGWRHATNDDRVVLAYFQGVAPISGGRMAGHVAIWDKNTGVLYSCDVYKWNSYWEQHLYATYVPLDDPAESGHFAEAKTHSEPPVAA